MPTIINVTQYGIARIALNTDENYGLETSNLNTCLGFIAKNSKYAVLMHFDTNLDTDDIAKNIVWLKPPYTVHIGINKKKLLHYGLFNASSEFGIQNFINRLKKSLSNIQAKSWENELEFLDTSMGSILIHNDGKIIPTNSTTRISDELEYRKLINFFNYLSKLDDSPNLYAKLTIDLQFDCDHWLPLPKLSLIAESMIKTFAKAKYWQQFIDLLQKNNSIPRNLVVFLQDKQNLLINQFSTYIKLKKNWDKDTSIHLASQYSLLGVQSALKSAKAEHINPLDLEGEPTLSFAFYKP